MYCLLHKETCHASFLLGFSLKHCLWSIVFLPLVSYALDIKPARNVAGAYGMSVKLLRNNTLFFGSSRNEKAHGWLHCWLWSSQQWSSANLQHWNGKQLHGHVWTGSAVGGQKPALRCSGLGWARCVCPPSPPGFLSSLGEELNSTWLSFENCSQWTVL